MSRIFAAATAVHRRACDPSAAAPVTDEAHLIYDAEVAPGWDIGGNANGGYLMAIAGRAMADAVGRPPLTLTAHYLRPAPAGPCTIDVNVVRSGRRLATVQASLGMDGREVIRLLGTFGEQTPGGPSLTRERPVELPAYDECELPPLPTDGPLPAMMDRLAVRIRPGDEGFRVGRPTGVAEIRGWFAFAGDAPNANVELMADGGLTTNADPRASIEPRADVEPRADAEPIDAIGLLLVADSFPPPVFNIELPIGWVPTVELTVHVRGIPVPGPLRCAFRSRFIQDGLVDEEGEMWDSSGALVAQSRQLALMPRLD